VDLLSLEAAGTAERPALKGTSSVIGGDLYTLTVGLPRSAPTLKLSAVTVRGANKKPVRARWLGHQGYATVTIESDVTQEVGWELTFEPAEPYLYPVTAPKEAKVTADGPAGAVVTWPSPFVPHAGHLVTVNGQPLGVAFGRRAMLRDLTPGERYGISVRTLWYDGSLSADASDTSYTP
jgi:hypothetical protein